MNVCWIPVNQESSVQTPWAVIIVSQLVTMASDSIHAPTVVKILMNATWVGVSKQVTIDYKL